MKNVHRTSTKQHGSIKSGISQSKNSTISQAIGARHDRVRVLLEGVKIKLSHKCVKVIILGVFVATMLKLQQFVINEPDKVSY